MFERRLHHLQEQHLNASTDDASLLVKNYNFSIILVEIIDGIAMLQCKAEWPSNDMSINYSTIPHMHDVKTKLELPKVSIPKFEGSFAKWQSFHDMFVNMIHNHSCHPNIYVSKG